MCIELRACDALRSMPQEPHFNPQNSSLQALHAVVEVAVG
jgi:hypothetical protein